MSIVQWSLLTNVISSYVSLHWSGLEVMHVARYHLEECMGSCASTVFKSIGRMCSLYSYCAGSLGTFRIDSPKRAISNGY